MPWPYNSGLLVTGDGFCTGCLEQGIRDEAAQPGLWEIELLPAREANQPPDEPQLGCLFTLSRDTFPSAWRWCEEGVAAGEAYRDEEGSVFFGPIPTKEEPVNDHSSERTFTPYPSLPDDEADARFKEGYRLASGREEWIDHLLRIIKTCEGRSGWTGYYGPHWTRAQLSGDTWIKVSAFVTGLGYVADPDDPFIVGLGAGWWARVISHPGDRSGWPVCWWT